MVVAMVAMWAYAFSPLARRSAPDAMRDATIGPRAESICKQTADELTRLPKAFATGDPATRADVVQSSNEMLARMVEQLEQLEPLGELDAREHDAKIYAEWINDWRTYLHDRQDYVTRLRGDRNARIFVTQKGAKQITEPIGGFARSNVMPSCQPPGDII